MKFLKYLGQGLLHYKKNLPCQDHIRTHTAENGNIILAVSDGCSSAEFAVEGSKINTQAVINIFTNTDIGSPDIGNINIKKCILDECFRLIDEDFSSKKETEPDKYSEDNSVYPQYSATLLFAVINVEQNKAVIGHIGDGLIVCTDKEANIRYISDAENINNQSNMTYFTTSFDADDHLKIDCIELEDIENVFLSTDGAYQMLLEHGFKTDRSLEYYAGTIAAQITHMVSIGEIKTNSDFVSRLDMLCYYPLLRKDDWAIVIWNKSNEPVSENEEDAELTPVIMMDVERAKRTDSSEEADDEPESKSVEETDEKTVEEVNEDPVENIDEESVEEVNEDPVENIDDIPVGNINNVLVDNIDDIPVADINETPGEELNEESAEETDIIPVEKLDEEPSEDGDKVPVEEIDEIPVEKISEAPVEETDETSVEKSDKEPSEERCDTAVEEVNGETDENANEIRFKKSTKKTIKTPAKNLFSCFKDLCCRCPKITFRFK